MNPGHWLDRPETVRAFKTGFLAILGLLALLELAIQHHEYLGFEGTLGFYAGYGFVSGVVLILFAKLLGIFLKREDSYYEDR
ncbi:MAG: hypothetical protein HY704_05925 [Gemmatimonadetes bacterium]|nr:hypothetical protein [Gemmatimonadota bacterium]